MDQHTVDGRGRLRSGESLTRTVVRTALHDDWTACAAAGTAVVGSASPEELRRIRARLVRGHGDRPGRVGLRALATVDAALACTSGGSSAGDGPAARPCAACAALRPVPQSPGT